MLTETFSSLTVSVIPKRQRSGSRSQYRTSAAFSAVIGHTSAPFTDTGVFPVSKLSQGPWGDLFRVLQRIS